MRYHDQFVNSSIKHFGVNLFTEEIVKLLEGLDFPIIELTPGHEDEQLMVLRNVANNFAEYLAWDVQDAGRRFRHEFYDEAHLSYYICHQVFPERYELDAFATGVTAVDIDTRELLRNCIDELVGGQDMIGTIGRYNGTSIIEIATLDFANAALKHDSVLKHFSECPSMKARAIEVHAFRRNAETATVADVEEEYTQQNARCWAQHAFSKYVRAMWIDHQLAVAGK